MNCRFCSTQMLPAASVCAACGAYLRSDARTFPVLLSVVGYCWLEYKAFTNLRIVGRLFAQLAPSLSAWLGNRKTVWVRRF
jgi:predicted amidophosphoribosyltransferase